MKKENTSVTRGMFLVLALTVGFAWADGEPISVVGKNVGWAYRQTAKGGVLDLTNRVGVIRTRDGKTRIDLRGGWSHAAVTYKGMD